MDDDVQKAPDYQAKDKYPKPLEVARQMVHLPPFVSDARDRFATWGQVD
jgi:hypothetical protein